MRTWAEVGAGTARSRIVQTWAEVGAGSARLNACQPCACGKLCVNAAHIDELLVRSALEDAVATLHDSMDCSLPGSFVHGIF